MPRSLGRGGRRWRTARTQVLAASTTCWLCGHGGADSVDHEPALGILEAAGLDPCDPQYLRPAHGVNGCPTCGRKCNREKSDKLTLPVAAIRSRDW